MKNMWLVQSEWFSGARLLSMDLLDAAYGPVGLVLPRRSEVRLLLRGCLRSYLESQPGGVANGWTHLRSSDLYSGFIDAGLASVDRPTRTQYEKWLKYVHSRDPSLNPWVQYEDVVSEWAHSFFAAGRDDWGLGADAHTIFTKVRTETSTKDVLGLYPTVDRLSLGAWDEFMLKLWHRDDGRIEIAYEDFVVDVKLDIRMWRFQNFIQWGMRSLPQQCLTSLQDGVMRRSAIGDCVYVPIEHLEFLIGLSTSG